MISRQDSPRQERSGQQRQGLPNVLPGWVEKRIFDFVAEKFSRRASDVESSYMLRQLTMHDISNDVRKGVRIAMIPYFGSLEVLEAKKKGTYLIRYLQIMPTRTGEERREHFARTDVSEKDLDATLERAWDECLTRSGRTPPQEAHDPHQPSSNPSHTETRRRLGGKKTK